MTREDKRSSFKSHNARLFPDTKMLTSECCRHTVKCRYCRKRVSEKVSSPYLPGSKSHSPKEQRCNSEPAGQTLHQLHQLARRPGGPPEDHPSTSIRIICRIHNLELTFFFFSFLSFDILAHDRDHHQHSQSSCPACLASESSALHHRHRESFRYEDLGSKDCKPIFVPTVLYVLSPLVRRIHNTSVSFSLYRTRNHGTGYCSEISTCDPRHACATGDISKTKML